MHKIDRVSYPHPTGPVDDGRMTEKDVEESGEVCLVATGVSAGRFFTGVLLKDSEFPPEESDDPPSQPVSEANSVAPSPIQQVIPTAATPVSFTNAVVEAVAPQAHAPTNAVQEAEVEALLFGIPKEASSLRSLHPIPSLVAAQAQPEPQLVKPVFTEKLPPMPGLVAGVPVQGVPESTPMEVEL